MATVEAPDFPAAIRIVDAVADEAEQMNHHPDIDIRWRTTRWLLTTHDAGGLTQLDIELAHRISAAARAHGSDARVSDAPVSTTAPPTTRPTTARSPAG